MRGVNKTIIVGTAGQDPDFREFDDGSVCNLQVATNEVWKDKKSGEERSHTEWHRLVFRNRLAEIAFEYIKKGSKIYIEGRNRTRSYESEGVTRYVTEIIVSDLQLLDSPNKEHYTDQDQ